MDKRLRVPPKSKTVPYDGPRVGSESFSARNVSVCPRRGGRSRPKRRSRVRPLKSGIGQHHRRSDSRSTQFERLRAILQRGSRRHHVVDENDPRAGDNVRRNTREAATCGETARSRATALCVACDLSEREQYRRSRPHAERARKANSLIESAFATSMSRRRNGHQHAIRRQRGCNTIRKQRRERIARIATTAFVKQDRRSQDTGIAARRIDR